LLHSKTRHQTEDYPNHTKTTNQLKTLCS